MRERMGKSGGVNGAVGGVEKGGNGMNGGGK